MQYISGLHAGVPSLETCSDALPPPFRTASLLWNCSDSLRRRRRRKGREYHGRIYPINHIRAHLDMLQTNDFSNLRYTSWLCYSIDTTRSSMMENHYFQWNHQYLWKRNIWWNGTLSRAENERHMKWLKKFCMNTLLSYWLTLVIFGRRLAIDRDDAHRHIPNGSYEWLSCFHGAVPNGSRYTKTEQLNISFFTLAKEERSVKDIHSVKPSCGWFP